MTLIMPAGQKDFNWSPKEGGLNKTASTGSKEMSDKDILYAAAKKVVQAQMALEETEETDIAPADGCPCSGKMEGMPPVDGIPAEGPVEGPAEIPAKPAAGADAVQVVQELADKANKAEEQAANVEQAIGKVEEALQGVKDAVGTVDAAAPAEGGIPEEVELDVEVEEDGKEEKEVEVEVEDEGKEVEVEVEGKKPPFEKKDDKEEKDEDGKKDEIVKESIEAKNKAVEMKTAASDDLVKTSKLSPETRNKISHYWKDILGYDPTYAKLMSTDFEK